MRNCDTRMTDEVRERFQELRCDYSMLPKPLSIMAAMAACLVIYLATAPILRAALQQDTSDRASGASFIKANPERVTLSDGSGSTEIEWDTGSESTGFIFVTEAGREPVLFANSSRGKEVARWIKKNTYVFELYGDDQRHTLLAKVTVSGSAGYGSDSRSVSWQI